MTDSITIEAGTDPVQARRMRAFYANPGDVVRPRALVVRPELKAAADAAGLATLTVLALAIGAEPKLTFAELPRSWDADMVADPRELVNHYGAMVRDGEGYWLVPMTEQGVPNGEPVAVDAEPSRWALHSVGPLEEAIGEGAIGEFVVAEAGSGHQLMGIPWHGDISDAELDRARVAVAGMGGTPSPR